MPGNIVALNSPNEETAKEKIENFLDLLRENKHKFIIIAINENNEVSLGHTLVNMPELLVMLHHLTDFNKFLINTYGNLFVDFTDDDD